MIRQREHRIDRRQIDDRARLAARPHLRHHLPRRRLSDEERAAQIDAQNTVELGRRQVEEIGAVENGGIVDEHIDRAAEFQRRRDQARDIRLGADIAAHESRAQPGLREIGRERLARRIVDVRDDRMRAGFREFQRDGAADPVGRAGDDDGLASK